MTESLKKGWSICYLECLDCKHGWVTFKRAKYNCGLCDSKNLAEPIYIGKVRRTLELLEDDHKNEQVDEETYLLRRQKLLEMYDKIAPLVMKTAKQIYELAQVEYASNNLSDEIFERIYIAMAMFSEIGMMTAAASVANILAMGYAERGIKKEIRRREDLADLYSAISWYEGLDNAEMQASLRAQIALRASGTTNPPSSEEYRNLLLLSMTEFDQAQTIYDTLGNSDIAARLEKKMDRVNDRINHVITAAATEAAAATRAKGDVIHGQLVKEGLVVQGELTRQGLVEQGKAMREGLQDVSKSIEKSGKEISFGLQSIGYNVRAGLNTLGMDIRVGMEKSSEKISKSFGGLGTKLVLGMLGGAGIAGGFLSSGLKALGGIVGSSITAGTKVLANTMTPIAALPAMSAGGNLASSLVSDAGSSPGIIDSTAQVVTSPEIVETATGMVRDQQVSNALNSIVGGTISTATGNPLGLISAVQGVDQAAKLFPNEYNALYQAIDGVVESIPEIK